MVCPKGTRTKGLTKKYAHGARGAALRKRARTEAHRRKAAFVESALERLAARDAAEGREATTASALAATPTVVGVAPARATAGRSDDGRGGVQGGDARGVERARRRRARAEG